MLVSYPDPHPLPLPLPPSGNETSNMHDHTTGSGLTAAMGDFRVAAFMMATRDYSWEKIFHICKQAHVRYFTEKKV